MNKLHYFSTFIFLLLLSGTSLAQINVQVDGAIRIGNDTTIDVASGTLRWSGTHFEGYDGTGWIQLDGPNTTLDCNTSASIDIMENAQYVTASDIAEFDNFGNSVAISDTFALIGSRTLGGGSTDGKVYLLHFDGDVWTERQIIRPENPGNKGNGFGRSMAIDSTDFIISAPDHSATGSSIEDKGLVFVYTIDQDSLMLVDTLVPEDTTMDGDAFGEDITISGDIAVVGAPNTDSDSESDKGLVYVYERSSGEWTLMTTLCPSTSGVEKFGRTVDVDDNWLWVGAPDSNVGNSVDSLNQGRVFVYRKLGNTWMQTQNLASPIAPGVTGNRFGSSVSVDGDYAAVRALGGLDTTGRKVFIYKRDFLSWDLVQTITTDELNINNGNGVDLRGDYLIIGNTQREVDSLENVGEVLIYHFDGSEWVLDHTVVDLISQEDAILGRAVATDMINIIAGTPSAEPSDLNNAGKVLLFSVDPD